MTPIISKSVAANTVQSFSLTELLDQIEAQQITTTGTFFKGMFPTQRRYPYLGLKRADSNIFFTALTIRLLRECQPFLDVTLQSRIDRIAARAKCAFPFYSKKEQGVKVYQFWPVGANNHFPNGLFLHHFKKFKSPPDVDDTALSYAITNPSTADVLALRDYLIPFANGSNKWNRKILKRYQKPMVYSTWMGTGAMPIEFDVVVLTNLLAVFLTHGIELNQYDLASLDYLASLIKDAYYLKAPFYAAPWYPSAVVILYHLVKFFGTYQPERFHQLYPIFKSHWNALRGKSVSFMEQVILNTIGLKLGMDPAKISFPENWEDELLEYPFYIGGMLTAMQSSASWYLARYPIFHWRFVCPAFNFSLVLEQQIECRHQQNVLTLK